MWFAGFDTVQTKMHTSTSMTTVYKIRKKLVSSINIEQISRIDGPGVVVQLDETAICRSCIINNPSSEIDDIPGIQWIAGGVVTGAPFSGFMALVPNRTSSTIFNILQRYVVPVSIQRTDGHRSYPSAAASFGSVHQIVPHVGGFRNSIGQTTNEIEGLWTGF